MAETKAKEVKEVKSNERELVPYKAPKGTGKMKYDITVLVNGKVWKIQRGKEIMIPQFVKEVLDNSEKQDEATLGMIEEEQSHYEELQMSNRI